MRFDDPIEPVCIARVFTVRVITLCEIAKNSLDSLLTGIRTDLEDFIQVPILIVVHADSVDGVGRSNLHSLGWVSLSSVNRYSHE